jgi:hypothetical protein
MIGCATTIVVATTFRKVLTLSRNGNHGKTV